MSDLIKINYETEQPTVSARDICKILDQYSDFTQFFIACSEMKLQFDREELKILIKALRNYYFKYGVETITYLIDSIHAEMTLPCNSVEARKFSESVMRKEILNNFNKIFQAFYNIETEKSVGGIGRIDIYAEKGERPVIIELKINKKNPNQQLISYGAAFKNPILIGITELPLDEKQKVSGIKYYSLLELKEEIDNWII